MGKSYGGLSRRAWLKLAAGNTLAVVIASCSRNRVSETSILSETDLSPESDELAATRTPIAASPTVEPATPTVGITAIMPEMVFVEGGEFLMGSQDGDENEKPTHRVQFMDNYYVGMFPVTFREYDRFCEATYTTKPQDEGFGRDDRPVIYIDWNDAVAYCNWLSEQSGLTPCYSGKGKVTKCDFSANGFRLPTEAEWEFAARGGVLSSGNLYAGADDPDKVAWYVDNSNGQTHPVGLKAPNELGLYDLSGNVWEWCWDKYLKTYYAESPEIDPTGPEKGQENIYLGGWDRVRRGGAANEGAQSIRVTARSFDGQAYKGFVSSFRLVRAEK